jgi:hypothetical protein
VGRTRSRSDVCGDDGYGGLQVSALLFDFAFRFVDL